MFNVYSDAGVLVAENVSREIAIEWIRKGLNSDCLHFSYLIKEVKDNKDN